MFLKMEKMVLTLNTLAKGEKTMQKGEYFANNPTMVKLFDDLEEFRNSPLYRRFSIWISLQISKYADMHICKTAKKQI